MTQNKLIGFCYLFIIGIALAMAFPLDSSAVGPLWIVTGALGLLALGAIFTARRLRPPVEDDSPYAPPARVDAFHAAAWILLLAAGLLFGYTRYLTMIQPPDRLLGQIRFGAESAAWTPNAPLSDTSFLKIRTLEPVTEDIELRLTGRLEALQPDGSWQMVG